MTNFRHENEFTISETYLVWWKHQLNPTMALIRNLGLFHQQQLRNRNPGNVVQLLKPPRGYGLGSPPFRDLVEDGTMSELKRIIILNKGSIPVRSLMGHFSRGADFAVFRQYINSEGGSLEFLRNRSQYFTIRAAEDFSSKKPKAQDEQVVWIVKLRKY